MNENAHLRAKKEHFSRIWATLTSKKLYFGQLGRGLSPKPTPLKPTTIYKGIIPNTIKNEDREALH